jgi:hypothetical protein
MYIVEAAKNPIVLNEGLFSQYTDKPFDGKYSNTKLVISKRIKNIDIDKAIDYIESNILPILDKSIPSAAEYFMTASQMRNQEKKNKIIESVFKRLHIEIAPSSILGNKYEGKKYGDPYVILAYDMPGSISSIFTGTIDNDSNMNFNYRKTIVTTHQ